MEIKEIKTYKFEELSEEVQRRIAEEEAQANWEWTSFGDITEYIDNIILDEKEGALYEYLSYNEHTEFNQYGTGCVYLNGYIPNENLEKYVSLAKSEGEEKLLTESYDEIIEILEKLEDYISVDAESLLYEIKVNASSRTDRTEVYMVDDCGSRSEIVNYFYEDIKEEHFGLVDRFGELIEIIELELVRIITYICYDAEGLGNDYCEAIVDIDYIIENKIWNDDEDYTEDGYIL